MTQASETENLLIQRATFSKNTIIPFVFLLKFCIITPTISLRGDCKFQEKLKIIIQNFGRKTNSIVVFFKKASLYFALDKH